MAMSGEQFDAQAWMEARRIESSIDDLDRLFRTGIFSSGQVASPFFQPSIVFMLILLNDLLQKAKSSGSRIAFRDDINQQARVMDVTDLVNNCRNAACHLASTLSRVEAGVFRFNVVPGRQPNAIRLGNETFGSDYDDDIAIFYGANRLYLKRHAVRAFLEAREILRARMN